MREFNTIIRAIAIILIVTIASFSQDIKFNHITTDDGLANGNVRTIIQDYQGFFWFGTEDGLQRYDGYSLVEYRHDPEDSTSLSSNYIFRLYEDSKKNLWFGTLDGGLCLYNRKENNFRCFKNDPKDSTSLTNNFVRCIYESADGNLYVGLKDGGFSYFKLPDSIGHKIAFTNFPIENDGDKFSVSDIIRGDDNTMLIAVTESGIHQFDPQQKEFRHVLSESIIKRPQKLTFDSKKRLWISTWGDGLYLYDKEKKQLAHYISGPKDCELNVNQIEGVYEDTEGNFWVPTDDGLSFLRHDFDPLDKCPFITYRHNEFEPSSLLSNPIKAFYQDNMNRLWVGSYFGGINIYDKHASKFDAIRSKIWSKGSLSNDNVSAFEEDNEGGLWIATDGGGLNYLKAGIPALRKDEFKRIDIRLNGEVVEKIKTLEFDKDGDLWIGTWNSGLFKLNPKTLRYEHFGTSKNASQGLLVDQVMHVKADPAGNLWIGCFSAGISFLDKKSRHFTHFPNLSVDSLTTYRYSIKSIHIDRKGRVWVAAELLGLRVFDPITQSFKLIENRILNQSLTVQSIHEDSSGTLWLGTNGIGLISYNPETQETQMFDEKVGLANNMIYAIEQDKAGNLWLSTNKGLSEFDPIKKTTRNYDRSDGLQGNQYHPESSFKSADGTLLFGGINGMDAFNPAYIKTAVAVPPVAFINFFLDNVEANVSDENSPLHENIVLAKTIDLKHDQNSFSVGFVVLEYNFSRRNQYAYMLDGLNNSWQYVGSERKATFTNLNPGTYTLRVKASNSDGVWSNAEKTLTIHIHPAWWQTTLFKIAIITVFTITTIAVVRMRLRYLIRQKRKLQKMVQQRTYELKVKNSELTDKIEEIRQQNDVLYQQKVEIIQKNNEIQAQNEELTSQNDHISLQRENLMTAEHKLKEINEQLEGLVEHRTKKLEETIRQLDKTVTELDRFVYSASHDLSAPLKSVLGLVQIARIEKDTSRIHEYYNHIEFSVQKLDRVIKSMVEFSRNYHLDIQSTYFDFHDLVDEVLRELAFWPEARKVSFRNTVAKQSVLKTDSQRMKVVLHNLISNSVKYADHNKTDSYIHIDFHRNGEGNMIIVADNGMGIEQERQSRIFEMYYRATDRSHGSGLGLFIVKEIILKLGGTIEVKSAFGTGSSFIINLPNELNGRSQHI